MDTLQRLFGFSRPYDGHSPPSGRKSLSASLPNDTAQPVVPSPARNSVQKSSEKAESRTSLSGVRSEGDVSRNRSTIDKTQSTAKQSASRALRGNSVADASLECPPSAPSTSLGHSTPTARTERSPPVPPKDSPKAYGLGPPSSGIPYDARAHGPESGSRATFKPPATPSPLRHEDALNANNSAALASATALRDSASPHGSDAVSSQIAHRSRPSPPRNDSLESRKVSSKMRQSPGVASPSHRGGTSDVTTNGAQAPTFASTNNDRLHRPVASRTLQPVNPLIIQEYILKAKPRRHLRHLNARITKERATILRRSA
ncbi:hypothetical protein EV401DRAFT_257661 [Pisolithus croceorrhizus]|nr:hypothetical protein EV401DRAFT_257661 [Pisolithus croceorrhizus]